MTAAHITRARSPAPLAIAFGVLVGIHASAEQVSVSDTSVHIHIDDAPRPVVIEDPWAEVVSRDAGHPEKPHRTMPGDRDRGDCPPYRYELNDCVRAGNPHRVARWAMPSITEGYSAWFVGGGAAFGGRQKGPQEGTWGLDYDGWLKPRRVWMSWTCGRYQGGTGAYAGEKRSQLFPLR